MAIYDGKPVYAEANDGYRDKGDYNSGIYDKDQPYTSRGESITLTLSQ